MPKNNNIIRKTVPFGPNEQKLYSYAEDQCALQGIKFATYVKKLIRESMDQPKTLDEKLSKILDKYFDNKNISIEAKERTNVSSKFTEDDKSALLSFMKD